MKARPRSPLMSISEKQLQIQFLVFMPSMTPSVLFSTLGPLKMW